MLQVRGLAPVKFLQIPALVRPRTGTENTEHGAQVPDARKRC